MESHWASFELRLDPIFRKRLNLTCRMARKNLNQHSLNRLCTAASRSRCQPHRKPGSRRPVSGRKTQAPKQTSGRERLSRPDLCVATKCHILINHQPGRFDVTMQCATRLELAAFSHENIALHRPSHIHRFGPDLTAYARVLPDRERSGGIDCALHLAVDEQLVQEFDRAFDRNSSGKKSAGLRWHERAVGWRWDDRWVWLIRLRGFGAPARRNAAKSVHGRIVPNHSGFRKRNPTERRQAHFTTL